MRVDFFSLAFVAALAVPAVARAESQPRETETGLPEHWTQNQAITVTLDPSLEDLAPGATDEVEQAMTTWTASIPGLPRVTFVRGTERVTHTEDGSSLVRAGAITLAGHENDLANTTTYAQDDDGQILQADVVFNTKYSYALMPDPTLSCGDVYDVGAVATHESGHFFGLDEDYDDEGATMYVFTNACDAHKRELTSDDTQAITALYATPATMTAHCSASPTPARSGASLFAFGFAAAAFARRMRRDGHARRSDIARARG